MSLDNFIDSKEVINGKFGYSINLLNPIQQLHIFQCEKCKIMLKNGVTCPTTICTICDILPAYTCDDFKEL